MKQFDRWNTLKKTIDAQVVQRFIKEREVWYVSQGINIGYEEDGKGPGFKRPVLVVKKVGTPLFVAAMTTGGKEDSPFYYTLQSISFNKTSRVILSQVKVLDKSRFIEKIGKVSGDEFLILKEKLTTLLL